MTALSESESLQKHQPTTAVFEPTQKTKLSFAMSLSSNPWWNKDVNELKSPGSLTNTERRRVVPAPHGPGHAGDVGVALEKSGTGVGRLPQGLTCMHNPGQGARSGTLS